MNTAISCFKNLFADLALRLICIRIREYYWGNGGMVYLLLNYQYV